MTFGSWVVIGCAIAAIGIWVYDRLEWKKYHPKNKNEKKWEFEERRGEK